MAGFGAVRDRDALDLTDRLVLDRRAEQAEIGTRVQPERLALGFSRVLGPTVVVSSLSRFRLVRRVVGVDVPHICRGRCSKGERNSEDGFHVENYF
jgi:hypothetical protein